MSESIQQLRIYRSARELEDQIYELVKQFPEDQFYGLSNDLRRSSAAVSHYITGAHRLFSYRLKLDDMAAARREAEITQKHLESARSLTTTPKLIDQLQDGYTGIVKQSWGLTKWLKTRLEEREQKSAIAAKEELVAAIATA